MKPQDGPTGRVPRALPTAWMLPSSSTFSSSPSPRQPQQQQQQEQGQYQQKPKKRYLGDIDIKKRDNKATTTAAVGCDLASDKCGFMTPSPVWKGLLYAFFFCFSTSTTCSFGSFSPLPVASLSSSFPYPATVSITHTLPLFRPASAAAAVEPTPPSILLLPIVKIEASINDMAALLQVKSAYAQTEQTVGDYFPTPSSTRTQCTICVDIIGRIPSKGGSRPWIY